MELTKTQKILLGTAITGVGSYFLYKYFFPADQESDQELDTGNGSGESGGSGGSGGSDNPLGSYQNVINFQKYYNKNKPMLYVNLVVDGIFGKDTKLAYKDLGQQYQNYLLSSGTFINAFQI